MTNQTIAIEFKNVSKIYKLRKKGTKPQLFYALEDVSFSVEKGTVLGVVGTNGSGKSTMASLLAEIAYPDEGEVVVNGSSTLVSIQSGLNKQLTGVENIEMKCTLLGLKPKQIKEVINGAIEYAELGEFIYQPVKTYSSGMKSRLGFSINLCLDTDILIADEVLSVGDKAFAEKCLNTMKELKKKGKTIVFISHSLSQIRSFCDKALWLEGGHLQAYGDCKEVCNQYAKYMKEYNTLNDVQKHAAQDNRFRQRIISEKITLFDRLF